MIIKMINVYYFFAFTPHHCYQMFLDKQMIKSRNKRTVLHYVLCRLLFQLLLCSFVYP